MSPCSVFLGAQCSKIDWLVLIHREVQPGGTGSDLKDHLGTHGGEEKSSMGNDDERDIPLSPIRGTTGGRDSLETASTSKLGAIVDMR